MRQEGVGSVRCQEGAKKYKNVGDNQSINQSIIYFRIISLHIIARSQLADYRNKPGTNIGKPVFMDDPGNLLVE